MAFVQPLLVGEANPYGAEPGMALYPLPERAAGGRLAAILGLTRGQYLRFFHRTNLCPQRWSMRVAREQASIILRVETGPVVLLGRKVAAAFGIYAQSPFTVCEHAEAHCSSMRLYLVPHPSGLNRAWNEPGAAGRARSFFFHHNLLPPRP